MNIFEFKRNIKAIYVFLRVERMVSAMMACQKNDYRVQQVLDEIPNGTEVCIESFELNRLIACKKTSKGLDCSITKESISSDTSYIMFKNAELALPVLNGQLSFSDAFNQSRIIVKGDTQISMLFVRMLDIAQSYMVTSLFRKNYLKEKPLNSNNTFKIRLISFFRRIK